MFMEGTEISFVREIDTTQQKGLDEIYGGFSFALTKPKTFGE
jgi:hypothetical protein